VNSRFQTNCCCKLWF